MALKFALALTVCSPFVCFGARLRANAGEPEEYTFTQFVQDFGRTYKGEEYTSHEKIFKESLVELSSRHARNVRESRSYSVGVYPFMDWTRAERKALHGYKPPANRRAFGGKRVVELQLESRTRTVLNMTDEDGFGGGSVAMRNQGNCGSCWAISAVEAVEAQLHRNGADPSVRLSAQALVDCVPNPQHCGGSGGCDGATGELAYTYMRDHGIPTESELPYNGHTGTCPSAAVTGAFPAATRAVVDGWKNIESNKAKPLMEALVQEGPAVVAVDANDWFDYSGGIYDGCHQDAEIVHAVMLKAYGTADDGKKYWLIQNSWGGGWGENGNIRLLLRDDEDSYCGMDKKPSEGLGCDGGPSEVRVCGQCGLLLDPVIPQGARLVGNDDGVFHPTDTDALPVSLPSAATSFDAAPESLPSAATSFDTTADASLPQDATTPPPASSASTAVSTGEDLLGAFDSGSSPSNSADWSEHTTQAPAQTAAPVPSKSEKSVEEQMRDLLG